MRWLFVIAIGCGGTAEPVRPTPAQPVVAVDAAATPEPDDPPEPKAPIVECAFERSVFCVEGVPTRVALQRPPFHWCRTTQPAREQSFYKLDAQFSAVETRDRRKTDAEACCYVDFFTRACD
jgi:hypothetical protein